jgi:hypothetical protein
MKRYRPAISTLIPFTGIITAFASGVMMMAAEGPQEGKQIFTFDKGEKCAPGMVPTDWKAEGTNQEGPFATWEVIPDSTAPSSPNVLALTKINHDSSSTFNICWTDKTTFKDGEIEVKFKAVSGKEDQGGGLMWRVKDKDNYYIARMNPLEDNFRLYYVKNGSRKQLAGEKVTIPAGEWHTMKIEHRGDHITGWLDGKKYVDVKDSTFTDEGGVGLWTKADAVTSFDNFTVSAGSEGHPQSTQGKPENNGENDKD